MTTDPLLALAPARERGDRSGIASVCSAHAEVIGAALALGRRRGRHVLVEATCNQVNHEGGYTGMDPAAFRRFVLDIAAREGFDPAMLILGGDHLGPNPWTALPASDAMGRACTMVAAYAAAGFTKIHLDASMACADDAVPLPESLVAERAARLAATAERNVPGGAAGTPPVYVIGTEVPVPGGAPEAVEDLAVTSAEAARETVALHAAAFAGAGIPDAFERIVALVVQPGVEYGNENVVAYDREAARTLVEGLPGLPVLFEAHSTDYQSAAALTALVDDGFAILKVGPGLTFALREALYGLDHVADVLFPARADTLRAAMERLMVDKPEHWEKYYSGTPEHRRLQRHYSYSDRIRYYWTDPAATAAVGELMSLFGDAPVPGPLVSQHLAGSWPDVAAGRLRPLAPELLRAGVLRALVAYDAACHGGTA